MVNINLIPNKQASIHISMNPTTVTRVGDIILLPNDTTRTDEAYTSRPPWKELFIANKVSYLYDGISNEIQFRSSIDNNNIIYECSKIDKQSIYIAIIQKYNGFRSAILTDCNINRVYINDGIIYISFKFDKCDMVYNK